MMQIIIDGETMEGAPGAAPLERMKSLVRSHKRVPKTLSVDGTVVDLARLASLGESARRVELSTVSLAFAVEDSYQGASEHLKQLQNAIHASCDALMLGHVHDGMEQFSGICLGLTSFFRMMQPLDALLGVAPMQEWARKAVDMAQLLLATHEAVTQQDWVLVGDQLRYEWSPRLKQWQDLLPSAKAEALALARVS